jgi:hypothetical protein
LIIWEPLETLPMLGHVFEYQTKGFISSIIKPDDIRDAALQHPILFVAPTSRSFVQLAYQSKRSKLLYFKYYNISGGVAYNPL